MEFVDSTSHWDEVMGHLRQYPGCHIFGYDCENWNRADNEKAKDGILERLRRKGLITPMQYDNACGPFNHLIQITGGMGGVVYLIDTASVKPPRSFFRWMADPREVKVVQGAEGEQQAFEKTFGEVIDNVMHKFDERQGFIDLQKIQGIKKGKMFGLPQLSTRQLPAESALWITSAKRRDRSRWIGTASLHRVSDILARRSESQQGMNQQESQFIKDWMQHLRYAAMDPMFNVDIFLGWAIQECIRRLGEWTLRGPDIWRQIFKLTGNLLVGGQLEPYNADHEYDDNLRQLCWEWGCVALALPSSNRSRYRTVDASFPTQWRAFIANQWEPKLKEDYVPDDSEEEARLQLFRMTDKRLYGAQSICLEAQRQEPISFIEGGSLYSHLYGYVLSGRGGHIAKMRKQLVTDRDWHPLLWTWAHEIGEDGQVTIVDFSKFEQLYDKVADMARNSDYGMAIWPDQVTEKTPVSRRMWALMMSGELTPLPGLPNADKLQEWRRTTYDKNRDVQPRIQRQDVDELGGKQTKGGAESVNTYSKRRIGLSNNATKDAQGKCRMAEAQDANSLPGIV